jgi:hypothetical protein
MATLERKNIYHCASMYWYREHMIRHLMLRGRLDSNVRNPMNKVVKGTLSRGVMSRTWSRAFALVSAQQRETIS